MKIAILGWGSLLWDQRPGFDLFHGAWSADGPQLPLEFSGVSKTRLGALTLVIDESFGSSCLTQYALSTRTSADEAISDMALRENTTRDWIGYYFPSSGETGKPKLHQTIKIWAAQKKFDAIVWTGHPNRFEENTGAPFSVDAAKNYLKSLPANAQQKALEYISRAPALVDTPLRRALENDAWFQDGVRALRR